LALQTAAILGEFLSKKWVFHRAHTKCIDNPIANNLA
jgi:hypothetical protein